MTNQLTNYLLHLADSALILTQKNAEWCGHGPILEQDIAITNITLDLIGQSRNFYQYAAELMNTTNNLNSDQNSKSFSEDALAYRRTEREFKNLLICEQPNGDWAQTVLRQFLFSALQYFLFEQLQNVSETRLAGIAAKALKEVTYHVTWSSEWVTRLGDGTDESKSRMEKAVKELWPYTGEMFMPTEYEMSMAKEFGAPDLENIKLKWTEKIQAVFAEATLSVPDKIFMQSGGKSGVHSEHLGFILSDLQYLQRTYPGAEW